MKGSDFVSLAIGIGFTAAVCIVVVNVNNRATPGTLVGRLLGKGGAA